MNALNALINASKCCINVIFFKNVDMRTSEGKTFGVL